MDKQSPFDQTPAFDMAAFRARQKSRNVALALVLGALVVLFFAISLVKIRNEAAARPPHAAVAPAVSRAH